MAPVIPCSSGAVTLLTKASFSQRRDTQFIKCNVSRRSSRTPLSGHRFLQSTSLRLLQQSFIESRFRQSPVPKPLTAIGTDVVAEEPNAAVKDEQLDMPAEASPESAEPDTVENSVDASSDTPSSQSKRTRPVRRSSMPSVKNEELVPGASFTGKVRSIQPFGAFVDFGAFTDGLVHVSKLSDDFVKDVANVVSVGQEVMVRIVDANMETGRISLTMRDSDDVSKLQQKKEVSSSGDNDKPKNARKNSARSNQRRNEPQKTSKFVKGQVLDGTVKNITRSGAYISLPDGEEGFLPTSEESEGFGNILGNSSLQIGQEVNVRVLRISRGQATLTMKKEEDVEAINLKLNQGVVHTATNPFVLAFRKNKEIAAFLDEREKPEESTKVDSGTRVDDILRKEAEELEAQNSVTTSDEELITSPTFMDPLEEQTFSGSDLHEPTTAEDSSIVFRSDKSVSSADSATAESAETGTKDDGLDNKIPSALSLQETESSTDSPILEDLSSANSTTTEASPETETNDDGHNDSTDLVEPEASYLANEVPEEDGAVPVEDIASNASSKGAEKEADSVIQVEPEAESSIGGLDLGQKHISEISSSEDEVSEVIDTNQVDSNADDDKVVENGTPLPSESEEAPKSASIVTNDVVSDGQNTSVQDTSDTASVSAALVKQLREETGAGMMDCKKALVETGGDIVKAQEFLRKKGLASADKKASRATTEGRIGSYIHDSRIGVLIEVNCETDFVSRGDIFKELVDDLAMQVAACPQVQYLVTEDVPEEIVRKEREIEMQKEDLLTKPEQIRSKIVDGRIRKRLEEFALLEQPYIKNDKMVVKDMVKQTIATIGENIKVKRFARYNLGEGLEKKNQDFAAEVAAQTTVKEPISAPTDQPPAALDEQPKKEESAEKVPSVAVSAALVKQLREETGAGMMDCKKALSETGGDIEKAQEYLRKKGLASAEKKSSRLASEGRISTYIHDSRIGVLLEVNSETDFVARNETFKELVDDLAMQIVACPQVEFVSVEDIPESVVNKEKELEMQREDLQSKPENIREKIVEGRVSKRLGELALLEQPFIKNDNLLVKDLVKQTVAALGENIRVRRFVKFTLGE